MLKVRVVLLLPEEGVLTVKSGYPPEDQLDQADLAAANWAWSNDRPAGRGSDTLPGAKRLFLPMRTGRGAIGVIGIDDDRTGPLLTPDQRRLLDALVDQGALAIERVLLVEDMDRVKRTVESDRLRGALLTSISHDLKTPLASVLGAASTMRDLGAGLTRCAEARSARHRDRRIRAAQPLHRQSARHDQAGIRRHRAEYRAARCRRDRRQRAAARRQDPRASQGVAGARLPICRCWSSTPCCSNRCCSTCWTTPPNMRRQAPRYRSGARAIGIRSSLQIMDEGDGIPPEELESMFDKFYRAQKGDHVRPGTGLGLAISRGFVEAMHGTISAANRTDRSGAVITIRLPIPAADSALDTAA